MHTLRLQLTTWNTDCKHRKQSSWSLKSELRGGLSDGKFRSERSEQSNDFAMRLTQDLRVNSLSCSQSTATVIQTQIFEASVKLTYVMK